jgi:glucose-1-phosphate adenylyltransferase
MEDILVMVLAGGASGELPVLTAHRSKAALPYGGRYRVIDFCLSNCANSGIHRVGILAQYNPASLIAHVGNGSPWDLNRRRGGLAVLQPYTARTESNWFRGTADALRQHAGFIRDARCTDVLVLSADQVYVMDYRPLIEFHRSSGSSTTVAVKERAECGPKRFGALEVDDDLKVSAFIENPEDPAPRYLSLGVYVFRKDVLLDSLAAADEDGHDIVFDVLMPLIGERRVKAHIFDGFWADVGWIQQYYEASMVLLSRPPPLRLNAHGLEVYSKPEIRSPSRLSRGSSVEGSLVANGCRIEGCVRSSILFPGVTVKADARVENSIVFADTMIDSGAILRSCIVDKRVRVGRNTVIGYGNPTCPNSLLPDVVNSGITVIGTQTQLPDDIRIGKNCLVGSDLSPEIIPSRDIVCGETILGDTRWQKISS